MAAQRVFCSANTLFEVIRLRKDRPYSSVFAVIDKLSDVYLECNGGEEVPKLAESNPIFKKLMKRPHRHIQYIGSIKEEIKEPRADDVFLMLPPESRPYVGYREKQGLLVTCSLTDMQVIDDLCHSHFRPFNLLTNRQKQRLYDHGEEYEDISSWKEVFDTLSPAPINSAIVIDNYIFHSFDRRRPSLYSIIKSLVPNGLQVPFHLTIFVYNQKGELKKEKMEQVIREIHELKLGSKIKVSIVAHTSNDVTHDRKILTNYHVITSGKGFGIIDFRGVRENAQGEIVSTFHNIEDSLSATSVKHQHSHVLDWMKDIYVGKEGMYAQYAFKVGDDFNNRLLQ